MRRMRDIHLISGDDPLNVLCLAYVLSRTPHLSNGKRKILEFLEKALKTEGA